MPAARLPLHALRSAMEQATGAKSTVSDRGTHIRVSVPAPARGEVFQALLEVLRRAEAWGSSDGTGEVRMWASVRKGE
ncbi:hypothetical protein [Streptomyces sp. NPDC047028]|uniref:hypothetical protein n=1 Tax=Streptomyces sp. NPDC047028 TaxID=3155793 RepID=UPI0033F48144